MAKPRASQEDINQAIIWLEECSEPSMRSSCLRVVELLAVTQNNQAIASYVRSVANETGATPSEIRRAIKKYDAQNIIFKPIAR